MRYEVTYRGIDRFERDHKKYLAHLENYMNINFEDYKEYLYRQMEMLTYGESVNCKITLDGVFFMDNIKRAFIFWIQREEHHDHYQVVYKGIEIY